MTNPSAKVEVPHNSGATSILVWNGLVTRMRLIGGEEKHSRARVDIDPRQSASQSLYSKLRHGSAEVSDA